MKKNWNEFTYEEKSLMTSQLNETYVFADNYGNAADAAYNVRVGYEENPDWFDFNVSDLDKFEEDIKLFVARYFPKRYAVEYYPGGQVVKYVGSVSDYCDGGSDDAVMMTEDEANELIKDLNSYVKNEYIGKTDEENEMAHWSFEKGEWGFGIEEF